MQVTIQPAELQKDYFSATDCPLANALKRTLNAAEVKVCWRLDPYIYVDGKLAYEYDPKAWDGSVHKKLNKETPYTLELKEISQLPITA